MYRKSLYWHPERQAGANSISVPGVTKTLGPEPVHQAILHMSPGGPGCFWGR